MWLAPILQSLALAATSPQAGADQAGYAEAMPRPIATRQSVFAIPFRIDQADQASREPVEVQLSVSGDRGRSWQLYSKLAPSRRHFMFRAGADGEYWFLVRTLDRSGQLRPQETGQPGLRVVVDTAQPKLDLSAERGPAGQITAQWRIDEPYPKPDSLTIQYRTTAKQAWQSVAVDHRNLQASGPTQTGEVTWWSQGGSGAVQVRAEVTDAAGNLAVSHAQAEPAQGTDRRTSPAAEDPMASWRPGTPAPPPTRWPADDSDDNPLAHNPATESYRNTPSTGSYPHTQDTGSYRNTPSTVSYPRTQDTGSYPHADVPPADSGLPPGERPRMVNSRQFELEYDVESVGPSGINRVELWGTRDGGQTWKSFALDEDRRSPLLVTVEEQGIYGFRVVTIPGAGPGGQPPQRGELPEIWIGVDLTKPTARITGTQRSTSPEWDRLTISWEAGDDMLSARPVSLSFGESPGGPWTTIASGLENTGRYAWKLNDRLPGGIYLRLEVRDEAGNVGVFETRESVALTRFRSEARARDDRALDQSNRTSPKRYYFR